MSTATICKRTSGRFSVAAVFCITFVLGGISSLCQAATPLAKTVVLPFLAPTRTPFQVSPTPFTAVEGNKFLGTVASFTGSSNNVGDYSAIITWGDGTKSNGTIVKDGNGKFHVVGVHTYDEQGNFITSVAITESKVGTKTAGEVEKVADAPLIAGGSRTLTLNVNKAFSGVIGSFQDTDGSYKTNEHFAGTVNWGDGTTSTVTFVRTSNAHYSIVGSHKYAKAGTYTVKITARDLGGAPPISITDKITVK